MLEEARTKEPDEIFCSNCGAVVKKGIQFCSHCGTRIGSVPADAQTAAPPRTSPASAQELNTKGQMLLGEGKLDEAFAAFSEAIVLAPDHVNAYLNRADVQEKLGRAGEAQADRQTARALTAAGPRTSPASAVGGAVAGRAGKTVPEGGDLCPMCKREVMPGRRYCHWCNQFLLEGERPLKAAGAGRRLGGVFIEGAIGWAIAIVAVIVDLAAGTYPAFYIIAEIGLFIFILVLWAQGLSPGKLILGMRVIKTTGERAGFWRMVLRETIGKFCSAIVFYLGFLWIIWDKNQQGWHDKIADTLVVVER